MVGDNVSFSAKLNVGEADSCLGGIEGDDVLRGDDVEEIVGDSENVGRAKLVVGTIVDVVFAVDSLRSIHLRLPELLTVFVSNLQLPPPTRT